MSSPTIEVLISAEISQLTSVIEQTENKLNNLGKNLTKIGAALTVGVTAPIVALGVASIKTFGDLEALQKGLIAVMGSADAAQTEFTKLIQVAKLPGLGLQEAVRGSVALQAAGFSADEARESLLAFGNALATVGKGKNELNFVILALTQLQNKTTGFGQDLRQLTEQLPQLRGALTAAFGTAESEEIAKLGVTGREVVELITKEFAKLPKVTGGIKNAFENLSDSTSISLARIGESINKAFGVESLIDKFASAFDSLSKTFSELDESTQVLIISIAGVAAVIGPILLAVGGLISALPILTVAFTALTGPIGLIAVAVAAAIPLLISLNSELSRTKNIAGEVKADLLAESLKESREEFDRLSTSLEKGGLTKFEAQNRAIDLLLKQELELLKARDTNKDIDFDAIKARVTALNELKETINKVTVSTALSAEELNKLADIKNEEVFRMWTAEADKFNAAISETIRLQKSIADVSESIASKPQKNAVSGIFEINVGDLGGPPIEETVDVLEDQKNRMLEFADQISGAFGGVGSAIASAFGQKPAFGQFLGQFLAFAAKLIATNFSIATSNAIAGATTSAAATGPAAAFTLPAFIAAAVGLVGSAFAAFGGGGSGGGGGGGGGGSVGAGVNSQAYTGSGLERSMNFEFVPLKIQGSDIYYSLEQQSKKRNQG